MLTTLFDQVEVGRLVLPNRIVMPPMSRHRADRDGVPTDLMTTHYTQRASAGLIVAEATQPSAVGQGFPNTPGLHTAAQIDGWRRLASSVHAAGGRIFVQLQHSGRISHPALHGLTPVAPSAVRPPGQARTYEGPLDYVTPHALTEAEIGETIGEFARAAHNAVDSGLDGVELHGAHGFLLHQFLSGNTNRREDGYGGSPENRVRFVGEVVAAVAAEIGADRVGLRISPGNVLNGIQEADTGELYPVLVRKLASTPIAYLHVMETCGRELTRALRREWPSTMIVSPYAGVEGKPVGLTEAQNVLADGLADLLAMGRYFMSNPDLPERLRTGAPLTDPDPATFHSGGGRGYVDYAPY